jgi:hypothetical protein
MSVVRSRLPRLVLPLALLALAACATTGAESAGGGDIPDNATPVVRTERNGDVITEYRVNGQLRMVEVKPSRGPTYYLYDRNGDGVIDNKEGDHPPQTYFKLFGWK